ncbi:uncharacterized protein A4U43_C04F13390 [Asparagus officinalis]|uniref:Uncharacterized protein n=1 Tax=Asparagus officinalis TaxID=4686 RepID=A0A5P1F0J2_ASPOF|nr:uncharacterized protein A4U43_C04F13390 [Asparagus officinalis]
MVEGVELGAIEAAESAADQEEVLELEGDEEEDKALSRTRIIMLSVTLDELMTVDLELGMGGHAARGDSYS